jgi:outer membrane protein insertion porin family
VSIDHHITGVVQVDSVEIWGNQRVEKEAIMAVLRTKKGDKYDPEKLDKDLRDIYKMGFFTDVKIETENGPKGKIVTFNVIEKPTVGRIVFVGNEEIDSDDLKKEVGIEKYSILDQNKVSQSINRLKEYYRQNGYFNVEIKERILPLPRNEVAISYQIKENEKVFITKIEFLGNEAFDDDDLKDIMETSEKGFFYWLSWLTKWGYLDKQKLEFDIHKITAFYHNHGFIKAKVGEPKINYVKRDGLHITIEVEEGSQYSPGKVSIAGDLIMPESELKENTLISEAKVFNREIVRKDILALKGVYADEGYAYAEITTRTKEDNEKLLIDITYIISKEQKVRFERITISGNTSTRDKVIRRELRIVEGEFFSAKNLKRSTLNLHRLGYFEDVQVKTSKGTADNLMNVDINVKERPTGSFSVGAGYSSVDSAFTTISVSQKNLFGYGQKLRAAGKIGVKTLQFDASFTEPWLFGIPLSATIAGHNWRRKYDDFTKNSWGGSLGLGYPLIFGKDEFTRVSAKYQYDSADILDIDDDAAQVIKDMEGRNVTSSVIVKIARDSRNRAWNASEGSVNSISAEYAGGFLGGGVAFNRYIASSAWYFPFIFDTVFYVRGKWGFIDPRPEDGTLPVFQKFMLGGLNSVRGFAYGDISPVDPDTGDRIGGTKMMFYNFEFRFPLLKEQGISGVVFYDAGNVFAEDENYTFSGIRSSVGTGIRWYSPLGPLRLEYGRNLDPREDEKSGKWEFMVGGEF